MKECCVCGKSITFGYDVLCKEHWDEYKGDLNDPWLQYLMSFEHRERRYRRKTVNHLSLEQINEGI